MSASRLVKSAVKIPMRIERGPTDILRALASTVKYSPKEPEVSLIDDSFLQPTRPNHRTDYILSKLSGKRAAKFFLNKHPEIFFRDQAEPKIEAFMPPEKFESEMDFSENDIKWCIEHKDPENGIIAYKSMRENDVKMSDETLLQFFEMICYTNEERIPDRMESDISRYFNDPDKELVDLTWKKSGIASKIFNEIKEGPYSQRVYSAMIAGLSKFNEHNAARQVFEDFLTAHPDKALYISAYDGLIRSVPRLNSSVETVDKAIEEIVKHMEANLVAPDLHVINSILFCYRRGYCDDSTCQKSFKLVNDMISLGIEPSLATYASLISVIVRSRSRSYLRLIPEIIETALDSDIAIKDHRDADFLGESMSVISNSLHNLKLASKLHKLYLRNPKIFSHQGRRWGYLSSYFKLIITTESLENILAFYKDYVPLTLRPQAELYDALAEALDLYQADEETIKKIGRDIIDFRAYRMMKNDAIFRKDPEYVKALEEDQARVKY